MHISSNNSRYLIDCDTGTAIRAGNQFIIQKVELFTGTGTFYTTDYNEE